MSVATAVVGLHLHVDRNLTDTDAFHFIARQVQTIEKLFGLVAALLFLVLGHAVVERHIEIRIDPINHAADDGAVGGRGYHDVPLGRGRGVGLGEGRARMYIEGDEPLLAGFQACAVRGQIAQTDPPDSDGPLLYDKLPYKGRVLALMTK